jgi:PmbA protein
MSTLDFEYSQEQLSNIAQQILDRSLQLGATSSTIEINEAIATNVDILNSKIENFETSYDRTLGLSVYLGNKRGSIGITTISLNNIDAIIKQALDIAKYTQEDLANGIADKEFICHKIDKDLQLYHPIDIATDDLINRAKNIEQLGLLIDKKISSSDGSSISLAKYNFVIASTNGLNLGYKTTRFDSSLSLIGNTNDGMQTDYWYSSARKFTDLKTDEEIAKTTAMRVLRRLNKGSINGGTYPVIFESPIAKSIIGNFLGAISGSNQFRKLSFLTDTLNKQVFPNWLSIIDDPFIIKGLSSCYFDNEGVKVNKKYLVNNGIVENYILSCYTARKLNMKPTGNAGGSHNIYVTHNTTDTLDILIKKMDKGLLVIETIGHGLDMVTGDYSVGASGLWVENGIVQYFVDNLTISGNLKEIFKNIIYINNEYQDSSIACGSMLVDGITISN